MACSPSASNTKSTIWTESSSSIISPDSSVAASENEQRKRSGKRFEAAPPSQISGDRKMTEEARVERLNAADGRLRIVFAGTTEFAATILRHLIESEFSIVGVFTQPDRP